MSQQEVLEVLEKYKKPLSRSEIASALNTGKNKISMTIKRLLIAEEIKCIEINRIQAKEKYGCKRRMLLYYV